MNKKRLTALVLPLMLTVALLGGCSNAGTADPTDPQTQPTKADTKQEEGDTVYTHRVILLSDTHYMSNESKTEYEALHPDCKASDAVGTTFGYKQTEKMQAIRDDIALFMENNQVEAVLTLGDLATDDYGYRNLPENYVQK